METRARFVLIGLFTVLGFLGMLGFILWLAKVQLDRAYAQYDILFGTVDGLSQNAPVRYNGIDVGTVLTIALDRDDPSLVRVRIEVSATTPIRTNTVAKLTSQGVTGVSYVSLEGTSAEADWLRAVPPEPVPVIRSEKSVVQDLMTTAPDLVAEATRLISDVRTFVTPENRAAIAGILANLETATGRLDALATRAEATLARAETTLAAAEASFATANNLMEKEIPPLLVQVRAAVESASGAMAGLRDFGQRDLPGLSVQVRTLINDASSMIARFDGVAGQIGRDPGRFLLGTGAPEYRRTE